MVFTFGRGLPHYMIERLVYRTYMNTSPKLLSANHLSVASYFIILFIVLSEQMVPAWKDEYEGFLFQRGERGS